ncbi:MAG: SRPBCC family protein [bacterium]
MTLPTVLADDATPSLSFLLAAVGGGLILGARPNGDAPARPFLTVAGMALLGAAVHRPIADALRRAGTRRRAASLHFSFVVDRPVEQVFAFCADFENFPRFIGALRQVRDTGDGRSHWCASTPSGGEIEWNATTTKFVTNSVIGWRSVEGSPVQTTGLLRFSPDGGSTCIRVAVEYSVSDSSMTDALAALVAPRRASELEVDIRRIAGSLDEIEQRPPVPATPT